jgi:8-amino-7-oxononanoate synthase
VQLENDLAKRKLHGNLRRLRTTQGLIDFSSNDYLGLARYPDFCSLVVQELKHLAHTSNLHGFGSTGSRLLSGNHSYIEELEKRIASFHGFDAGLIFSSGYMANCGLLSAVAKSHDTIFYDSHIHASMKDGITLSKAKAFPFKHNDCEHLEKRLKNISCKASRYILVESVYSTDGSASPLKKIAEIACTYDAKLIVDEAHAVGVFGTLGQGRVFEEKLHYQTFAQITTFGKALGVHGAIVLGSVQLKEYLLNFAKTCIYTTALPLSSFAAIKCAYAILPTLENERSHLQQLIQFFQRSFQNSTPTAIQPIRVKGNERVQKLSQKLAKDGFDARAIMSPTVRRGQENVRIILHSFNSTDEIMQLQEKLCATL